MPEDQNLDYSNARPLSAQTSLRRPGPLCQPTPSENFRSNQVVGDVAFVAREQAVGGQIAAPQ